MKTANVQDFGAIGRNSIHDDTASIQAALDSGLSVIEIPEGVYKVSNLIVPANVSIRGAGAGIAKLVAQSGTIFSLNEVSNVSIVGLSLIGGGAGVRVQGSSYIKLDNLEIKDMLGVSVGFFQSNNLTISNCDLSNGVDMLLEFSGCQQINVRNNTLHDSDFPAIFVGQNSSKFQITNNHIFNVKTYGIFLNDFCDHGVVANNVIDGIVRIPNGNLDKNSYGICLQSDVSHVTISNNIIENVNTGIYLAIRTKYCSVRGNTINNTRIGDISILVAGIYLDWDCDCNSISGNTVRDCDRFGILVQTNSIQTTIMANTISLFHITAPNDGAITCLDGCNNTIIMGNVIDLAAGTPSPIVVYNSSGCIVDNNIS